MKRAVAMMVGAVIAALLGVTASAGAATVQVFNVPSADSGLQHIVAGPDGALWFTERKAGQVGRITTSGQISEYPIPNNASGLADTGPDQIVSSGGAIWFLTDIGESVYAIAPAASPSPTLVYQDQLNNAAALGPSDNGGVWLMEAHGDGNDGDGDALVRVNPDGSAVDYPATHPNNLYAIALAPDGAAWYNDGGSYLKRVDDAGNQLNVPLPQPSGSVMEVSSIAFGTDGSPWFTGYYTGAEFGAGACCAQIGHIAGGVAHLTPVGPQHASDGLLDHSIIRAPDGSIWFAFGAAFADGFNGVGRIDPASGQIQVANLSPYDPTDIAFGSDGALWFIDQGANQIGRITINNALFGSTPTTLPPAPRVSLSVPRQSLGTVGRHKALSARCQLSGAGTCAVTATVAPATARHLGLRVPRHAAAVTLAHATRSYARAGTATLRLALSRGVLRALRHVRRITVTLTAISHSTGHTDRTAHSTVTLRR
jgi:virginiamycin B lyase